jgi:hypothetical protein
MGTVVISWTEIKVQKGAGEEKKEYRTSTSKPYNNFSIVFSVSPKPQNQTARPISTTKMGDDFNPDAFTLPFQLTKSMHRDVYPAVNLQKLSHLAAGKVIIVTGASGGLGFVSIPFNNGPL